MPEISPETIERALITNDLSRLTEPEKLAYYNNVCTSLGLNPLTQPFDFILLNGKLRLYAKKDATEQLRKIYGVAVTNLQHNHVKDLELYIVTASGSNRDGREDVSTGAVSVKGLYGESLANAIMKAETKAKRRLTLSICGLGILDETEIESTHVEESAPTPMPAVPAAPVVPEVNHVPATPTEAPRPGEVKETKKRGRPAGSKNVQKTDKRTDFEFGANQPTTDGAPSAGATNSPAESGAAAASDNGPSAASDNIHGVATTDADLPSNLQPPRKPTAEESKKFQERCMAIKNSGIEGPKIRQFIWKTAGVSNSNDITFQQWENIMEMFDNAEKSGKLKELIG